VNQNPHNAVCCKEKHQKNRNEQQAGASKDLYSSSFSVQKITSLIIRGKGTKIPHQSSQIYTVTEY